MKKLLLSILSQTFFLIVFAQVDLSKDLVMYYPFSGNYTDASGLGSTASNFNGGPSFSFDRKGLANNALLFTGNGSLRFNASNNALNFGTTTGFSMSFWFKTNQQTPLTFYYGIGIASSSGVTFTLNEYSKGEFYFIVRGSNSSDWVELKYKNTALLDNQWHHLLIIVNQTNKAAGIFIDGTYSNAVSFSGKTPNASPEDKTKIYVGDSYIGGFDELRFYSRALNQSEIDALAGLSSSSVQEFVSDTKFFIENPASNNLNISFESPVLLKTVKIYAINGKENLLQNFKSIAVENISISLTELNDGLFLLEMVDIDNRVYRKRIVVAH